MIAMKTLNAIIWLCELWSLASMFWALFGRFHHEILHTFPIKLLSESITNFRMKAIILKIKMLIAFSSSLLYIVFDGSILNCPYLSDHFISALFLILNLYFLHLNLGCLGQCSVLLILMEGRKYYSPDRESKEVLKCQNIPLQHVMERWQEDSTSTPVAPTSTSDVLGQHNKMKHYF